MQDRGGTRMRDVRVFHHDQGRERWSAAPLEKGGIAHDERGGPTGREKGTVLRVREEGNRSGSGALQWGHPGDFSFPVPSHLSAEARREFAKPQGLGAGAGWGGAGVGATVAVEAMDLPATTGPLRMAPSRTTS